MTPSYFKRLDLDLAGLDFARALEGGVQQTFPTIRYFGVSEMFKSSVLGLLPSAVRKAKVLMGVVPAGQRLPPHTDYETSCAINIYHQPGGDNPTVFYEPRAGAMKHWTRGGTANWYDDGDVEEVGCFVAEPMDVYLINSSRVHSIEADGERRFVSVVWREKPFAEIVKEFS